jgi:pilus assembly protein CpaD
MTNNPMFSSTARRASTVLALMTAVLLAGCSQDYGTFDDEYVATSVEERYPIRVVDAPVKINVSAKAGSLRPEQLNSVINFAQDARGNATSIVTVSYASGSRSARNVAEQTVGVLVEQGVPRSMIRTSSYKGTAPSVTLAFHRKVAVTKECGDWSENLKGNQYNEPYPNQGCALQNNMAAMVANPEDFETPRGMSPAYGAARSSVIKKYNAGAWTAPNTDPGFSEPATAGGGQ